MIIDIRVPEAGESITQVELARWLVKDGDYIDKNQEIAEIDSDKASLTINAADSGTIKILVEEGSIVEPKSVIGTIDTSAAAQQTRRMTTDSDSNEASDHKSESIPVEKTEHQEAVPDSPKMEESSKGGMVFSPQANRTLEELGIDPNGIVESGEGRRITKKDVMLAISQAYSEKNKQTEAKPDLNTVGKASWGGNRDEERVKMSMLRKKIAERLVAVKNETAMLTTFNEVDMSGIIRIRKVYQDAFVKKHGFKLGFMSFFAMAVARSIPYFPQVNGTIDGDQIVIPAYADIGVAVSTPKGLMVPVVRNAESMNMVQLEEAINTLAQKARDGKISIEELQGGTISITNGGIFGSMLSTPIINPPQSAILGMHNILERPVAIDGKVEIRPMMYVALSYDHRIVDGRESVGFLVKVKEMIENPVKMLFHGGSPEELLLNL